MKVALANRSLTRTATSLVTSKSVIVDGAWAGGTDPVSDLFI
jgi:hypothetical protein